MDSLRFRLRIFMIVFLGILVLGFPNTPILQYFTLEASSVRSPKPDPLNPYFSLLEEQVEGQAEKDEGKDLLEAGGGNLLH
jgi:hypothetical protein